MLVEKQVFRLKSYDMALSPESQLITNERNKTTFNVTELTNILDGGLEKTALRKSIERKISLDPNMKTIHRGYLNKEQINFQNNRKMMYFFTDLAKRNNWHMDKPHSADMEFLPRTLANASGLLIHAGAFVPSIVSFGTPEQAAKWLPLAKACQIIGAYAQTELGHGTNLRRLETTATFDPRSQEFIMNTPSISSMKWWPGALGEMATHALVMAQLITRGENHGMQAFIVPVRDMTNHKPLPGITVGSIGPTLALDSTDNGYLRMDNVRIPKENMLAKYAYVDSKGKFQKIGNDRLMYASMVNLRVVLAKDEAVTYIQMACTIAARYSCVRKQGSLTPGGPEVQIIDYVTQQNKIIPYIALSYALHFNLAFIRSKYVKFLEDVKRGDLSNMAEMHMMTAGMKAIATERTSAGVEILRRSCGGHGYAVSSGLPYILLRLVASCTYEGENTVLYLQAARYLIKTAAKVSMGQPVDASVMYLTEDAPDKCQAANQMELCDHSILEACFKHRSRQLLLSVATELQSLVADGMKQMEAWNLVSIQLVNAAKAHMEQHIVSTFSSYLRNLKCSSAVREVLDQLCSLNALHQINNFPGDFLKDGYLSSKQLDMARKAEVKLLASLRRNVVGLVDAFDFTDDMLGSCIGSYDGNAYERLYEWAKNFPSNKTDVHEEIYKYLRPHLHQGRDILNKMSKL
uniref:peroxisomal acyl-coenzyme A oxidase 1 isoform X2 n=1 Tax=Ciona intestinalis TaxID=7719 RepID=UPI000521AE33|nr:peroxisomal acyl-coenzyme A oxidase 1 isoform X2 [Ciona intestinalis]|eukprot:XP_009857612.1 peroxisomal acyl-coenzyme A oxidase 1 isoform X2 [Ciona intestinalis]